MIFMCAYHACWNILEKLNFQNHFTEVHLVRLANLFGRKWTLDYKYCEETRFPNFIPGAFYILLSDLLNLLFNYVQMKKTIPFHTDDAYAGVAMRDFKVNVA